MSSKKPTTRRIRKIPARFLPANCLKTKELPNILSLMMTMQRDMLIALRAIVTDQLLNRVGGPETKKCSDFTYM